VAVLQRIRNGQYGHLALGAALTAALGFHAGGFFPGTVGLVAMLLAVGLAVRITVAERPFAGWSPALAVAAGCLAALAAWTLLSSLWSDAPGRALMEFDRALLYVLVLMLTGSFAARAGDLAAVLRWTALALAVVALAGLATRLLPDVLPTARNIVNERLSFPMTYWNAQGLVAALAAVLGVHLASSPGERAWVRVLAAALLPALAVTAYFTFSRGAIALAPLGMLAYAALARPAGLPGALLAALPPAIVAVRVAYGAELLAEADIGSAAAVGQGRDVLLVLLACTAVAAVARILTLRLDRRLERVSLAPRTRRAVLASVAVATVVALTAGTVALDVPQRATDAWASFSADGIVPSTGDLRDRLTQLGNNGRFDGWRVARDAFADEPLHGTGAGTFRLAWERERPAPPFQIVDAHSLYLEAAAELGIVGVALLLVALLTPPVVALRRLRGPQRHAAAAFAAASLVLLVHAGVDWDWEMPALFVWFFAAAGVCCAAGAAAPGRAAAWAPGRLPRVLGGLACLLVALTPALVAVSQAPLDRAVAAFHADDCAAAVDGALDSLGRLRVRPEPYEVLGYCNARGGAGRLAVGAMTAARRRDPRNWQYAYGLALAEAVAGGDPRPAAAEARRLNPLEPLARDLHARLSKTKDGERDRWRRIAQRSPIPSE
jgi:hypothetical protein